MRKSEMTFSDAEEDQPSIIQSGNMSNGISDSSRGSSSMEASANDAQAIADDQTAGPSINNPTTANDDSLVNEHEAPSASNAATSSSTKTSSSSNSNTTSGSQDSEASGPATSQSSHLEQASVNNSSSQTSLQFNADSVVGVANNVKGLGTEKVMEKLQQIHGYIQQTAAAMEALEREGDLNKIGQYNTLVKCMRDLKKSEMKLTSHLNKIKERSSKSQPCFEESLLEQFETLYKTSKTKENEYLDILSRSLLATMSNSAADGDNVADSHRESGTSGSESIGVVGDLNGSGNSSFSMEERLARHESEQQQLSERLRESLVRREELMTRYEATRERLNNLKRQRLGLVQEERKLLQSVGAPENLYENPIPGVDTWTIEQLENAIRDFQGLRDKVNRLFEAYSAKLQALDEEDAEARIDLQRKIDQIVSKKAQIGNALNQLHATLQSKGGAVEVEILIAADEIASGGDPIPDETTVNSVHRERIPSENEIQAPDEERGESEGASGTTSGVEDMESKQHHLRALKDQLLSMRKLLHVTQDSLPQRNDGVNSRESIPKDENVNITEEHPLHSNEGDEEEEPLIDSTIVGVNGEVIHLSELERRNPQVVSKYRQLSEAKQRLAKMEEIMAKIAEARENGKSLTEVLSPENMAILTEARREEETNSGRERSRSSEGIEQLNPLEDTSDQLGASNESLTLQRRTNRDVEAASNPKVNEICKKSELPSSGKNKWEREREISAMQYHFKKKAPGIPAVNEGFKLGLEKGAIKKQARELLNERGNDPRQLEVAALQEELKEKKNALEALMRRMGKSSSFTVDNISDNISENVSDLNSETFEKPLASWGPSHSQGRYYSDHCQSDEDLLDANEEELLAFNIGASQAPFPSRRKTESLPPVSSNTKNRNKFPPKIHSQPEHNRFSVNNLSDSLPKSVRPKQNRAAPGTVPVTSWENVTHSNPTSYQNPNSKVQNTVAAALSQLSQVQETINSLYGDLRAAELSTRQQEIPSFNPFGSSAMIPQFPYILPQTYMPNYSVSPLPNSQGRGDLGASNQILAGLQQCFSQLYLHSLEIQSLSKHLQIVDQREKSSSPPHPKLQQRSSSCERLDRYSVGRRTNENFNQTCPPRFNPNFQNSQNVHYEDRKRLFPERREILNSQSNETFPRSGVSNPLYASLFNIQQAPTSWQMESNDVGEMSYGDKNLFHPFEASATNDIQQSNVNGDVVVDSAPRFPVDAGEISDLPWSTMSNPQMQQQQSSDILNNQVLPGTRANNYWDNFRSYSRQNPLSSTAKFNTREQFPYSGSSTPSRRQSLNTTSRLQPPVMYENKTRHTNVSCPNNSINKASDKNSSTSRSQNKVGARARCYAEQKESSRQLSANSYRNGSAGAANHRLDNVSYKRNNRHEYVNDCEQETFNQLVTPRGQGCVNNEGQASNNSRRISTEGEEAIPRNSEENCPARNMGVRRERSAVVTEGSNSSEAFNEVIREAESLMERHSQQPQFLLQLFHHAAKITSNTDQQVALELLRELSYQRQRNNIQNNRWASNSSVTQSAQSDSLSFPAHVRETDNRNLRSSNKNSRSARGVSGSDASESGLTSDEEETKVLYQLVKNLPQATTGVGIYPPLISSPQAISDNNPSSVGVSPIHVPKSLSQNQHSQPELRKEFSKDIVNIVTPSVNKDRSKSENKHYGNRLQRKRHEVEISSRNYIPSTTSCESPLAPSNAVTASSVKVNPPQWNPFEGSTYPIGDKHNNKRQMKKSPRRNIAKAEEEKSNFSLKNDKNFSPKAHLDPLDDATQEPVTGFEALVSSSLREVLMCFENADYSLSSTPQILDSLHLSIMRQVQFHSSTLDFSANFISSIDSQLKTTLHGYHGERLSSIRQELAAAVTQVLIQEYCSLFMQQDNALNSAEDQAMETSFPNDPCVPKKSEQESNNKRTIIPHVFKQTSSNSLFSNQSNATRPVRTNNASWAFNSSAPTEDELHVLNKASLANPNVNSHTREEELKCNNSLNIKGKGAIAKNSVPNLGTSSNHRDEAFFVNQEPSNALKRESPFPEASSFPESWVVQRGNVNSSDVENVYSFSESSFSRERDDRNIFGGGDNLSYERNDAEADQEDHVRNADFLNVSLPVHDLAEADQSQDPLEADCADSSIENDQYEAASASSGHQEPKEYPLRFMQKKKVSPEQGLDEVPTRLLNAMDRASSPGSSSGRYYTDENTESRIPPHRIGHYPQQNPSQSTAPNHSHSEQSAANHASESSSGIGG